MGRTDDTERGVCTYRGDQTLVQGRLKVRTGEKRGHRREGLREWVSEVEMFAGCLKEDGVDAMLVMEEICR